MNFGNMKSTLTLPAWLAKAMQKIAGERLSFRDLHAIHASNHNGRLELMVTNGKILAAIATAQMPVPPEVKLDGLDANFALPPSRWMRLCHAKDTLTMTFESDGMVNSGTHSAAFGEYTWSMKGEAGALPTWRKSVLPNKDMPLICSKDVYDPRLVLKLVNFYEVLLHTKKLQLRGARLHHAGPNEGPNEMAVLETAPWFLGVIMPMRSELETPNIEAWR